jgi:DNA-binding MarR family transcriptional regulator
VSSEQRSPSDYLLFVVGYTHATLDTPDQRRLEMTTGKKLTPAEWATVVVLYERGDKNTRQLGEQFGVSRQAIEKGLKERGIEKASNLDEVRNDVDDAARAELARRVAEANKLKSDHASYVGAITKITMKKIADANQASNLPSINADLIVLGNAMKIVAKGRDETWKILGIDDLKDQADQLPDLNIGEYTPDEIAGIQDAIEESYQSGIEDDEEEDQGIKP